MSSAADIHPLAAASARPSGRVAGGRPYAPVVAAAACVSLVSLIPLGFIVWVALTQSEAGRLDFAMFLSYCVALLTLLERLKGLSGINAAMQRGIAASGPASARQSNAAPAKAGG